MQQGHELVDVFLGLRKGVEIDHLEGFEVRFGIPIPFRKFTPPIQTVDIDPYPVDICTVAVRNPKLALPNVFDAELIVPAIRNLPLPAFKYLVRAPLFSLLLSSSGEITFWPAEDLHSQKQPPDRWVELARLLLAFASGKTDIQIRSRNPGYDIDCNFEEKAFPLDPVACERWLTLWERASHLAKLAGLSPDEDIFLKDIVNNAMEIVEASELFRGNVKQISFTTTATNAKVNEIKAPVRTLIISCVSMTETAYARASGPPKCGVQNGNTEVRSLPV